MHMIACSVDLSEGHIIICILSAYKTKLVSTTFIHCFVKLALFIKPPLPYPPLLKLLTCLYFSMFNPYC